MIRESIEHPVARVVQTIPTKMPANISTFYEAW